MKQMLTTALTIMLTISVPAYAEELNYNLYHLSTSAEDNVANDTMKVTLLASHQAQQSSEATKEVNKQMDEALRTLKATKGIHYETGNYQTHPIYQNQQISGWRASQQIELRSTDVDQLSALVGKLQKELKVSSMSFDVSKQVRQQTISQLSVEALNQFKARAELIQKTMGADQYQIVAIDINSGSQAPPFRPYMMRSEMVMAADAPPPAVESGDSTINVDVSGQIQLIFD